MTPSYTVRGAPIKPDLQNARKRRWLGVPFDCGNHPVPHGSRRGPTRDTWAIDWGDAYPETRRPSTLWRAPGRVRSRRCNCKADAEPDQRRVRNDRNGGEAIKRMRVDPGPNAARTATSLCREVRAAASRYAGMVAVHLDAHTTAMGTIPTTSTMRRHNSTHRRLRNNAPSRRLSYHIGIRGTPTPRSFFSPPPPEKTQIPCLKIIYPSRALRARVATSWWNLRERLKAVSGSIYASIRRFRPSCATKGGRAQSGGGLSERRGHQSFCAAFSVSI